MRTWRAIGGGVWVLLLLCLANRDSASAQNKTASGGFGEGRPCQPSLVPSEMTIGPEGRAFPMGVQLAAPADCDWLVRLPDKETIWAWPLRGRGDALISVVVNPNTTSKPRTLRLSVVLDKPSPVGVAILGTLVVEQAAASIPSPPCSYTVSPSSTSIGAGGGRVPATVATTSKCPWIAYSLDGDIKVSSASGTGSATISLDVPRNDTITAREFTVSVAGRRITVRQAGVTCTYSPAPGTAVIPHAGGELAIDVRANRSGCPQAVITSSRWLVVTQRADATGSGRVIVAGAASSWPASRPGFVAIGGTRVQVAQEGAAPNGTSVDSGNRAGPVGRSGVVFRDWKGTVVSYGIETDVALLLDADGDGILDRAVFRRLPGTSVFYIEPSSDVCPLLFDVEGYTGDGHLVCRRPYGTQAAIPLRFNLDGDPFDDVAVYDPASLTLYVTPSSGHCSSAIPYRERGNDGRAICSVTFGLAGDVVVPGDYDGDGLTDLAVWRPSSGYFHVLPTRGSGLASQYQVHFGLPGDVPVPARFLEPHRTALAVYRPSQGAWFVASDLGRCPAGFSTGPVEGGVTTCVMSGFGWSSDAPIPQDYDGDGLAEPGLARASTGEWFMIPSSASCSPTVPNLFANTDGRLACRTTLGFAGSRPLSGSK